MTIVPRAGLLALALACAGPALAEERVAFGPFGPVVLYHTSPSPARVILFVSGDGGWNQGVVDMARALADDGALVVGVDMTRYLKTLNQGEETCTYAAADFERLSKFVQKKQALPVYHRPILIGYSSGATLVYAVLAQAPPGTFQGAVSLGFCPDLPLKRPLCRGSGLAWTKGPKDRGVSFLPAQHLEQPWIVLQGAVDQVCRPEATTAYVERVSKGEVVLLPKVGHGFSVHKNWMPQLKEAVSRISASERASEEAGGTSGLSDLPLVELPAEGQGRMMAVIVSGDGGWASLDRDVGRDLAGRGIPVVGLNSLRYFWSPRTPDEASKDLDRIVVHYLAAWKKERVVVIGYSLGADVVPFMVSRLPPATRGRVAGVVLLGPSKTAQFEFHLRDWLGLATSERGVPVLPELETITGVAVLCVAGADEADSLCRLVDRGKIAVRFLPGGHHFEGDYRRVVEVMIAAMDFN